MQLAASCGKLLFCGKNKFIYGRIHTYYRRKMLTEMESCLTRFLAEVHEFIKEEGVTITVLLMLIQIALVFARG